MKKNRIISIGLSFGAVLIVFLGINAAPTVAKADNAPTTAATPDCVITTTDTDQVAAAAAQGFAAELAARKALLSTVITCAKADAQTLQANLQNTAVNDDAKILQSQLSDKLNDALNYYDLELAKVSDAGIAGTQAIAAEVLGWRKDNYDPLNAQINNFILWSGNQDLFSVAQDRLGQTQKVVAFMEEAGPNPDLENTLAKAETLMQTASEQHEAAKAALLQFLSPNQSLALIQESLQSLSDAYQRFSDINTIVQKLLPTVPPGK